MDSDNRSLKNEVNEGLPNKADKRRKIFDIVYKILGFALSIVILWLLIWWAGGINYIWVILKEIPVWTYIVAFVIYSLGWLLRGWRWKLMVNNLGIGINILTSTELVLIGNTYNLLLPAKLGDIARIVGLKQKHDSEIPFGLASVVTDRFLDLLTVVVFSLICLPFVGFNFLPQNVSLSIYISLGIVVIGILFFIVLFSVKNGEKLIEKLPSKISKPLILLYQGLKLAISKRIFILILFSSLIWIFESIIAYLFLFVVLSEPPSFIILLLAIMLGNLSKALPITPGGIGAYEAVFSSVLLIAGIPPSISVSIALIDHLFKNIYTILFGIIANAHFGISISQLSRYKESENKISEVTNTGITTAE